jgi:Putative adhesin
MKKLLGVFLALALVATLSAQSAEGSFTRDLKVSGSTDLRVRTGAGGIVIHRGPAGSVHIYAKIKASGNWFFGNGDPAALVREIEQNPPVTQTGNIINIGQEDRRWNNVSISYELTVPEQTQVKAGTGSGGIDVSSVTGPLDAATGSGAISAEAIGNRVSARTGSGSIKINSPNGSVEAATGSGAIELTSVNGSVEAHTGSGGISVLGAAGDVKARTGSGHIKVERAKGNVEAHSGTGGLEVEGTPKSFRWDLHTASGSVKVGLPNGTPFEVDAETHSGSVTTSHPVTVSGTVAKNALRGVSGRGDNRLYIRVGSGSIRID